MEDILAIVGLICIIIISSILGFIAGTMVTDVEFITNVVYVNQTGDCIDEAIRTLDQADEIKERVWNYDRY